MIKRILLILCVTLTTTICFSDEISQDSSKKSLLSTGYQVGGQTLIGVDYSYRITDLIGVHLGGGFAGYACGLNIYTSKSSTSGFFSINYEDGGYGLITLATFKWNGLWAFGEEKAHGVYYNIGMARILTINEDFKELLYGDNYTDFVPTLGLGYGFRF